MLGDELAILGNARLLVRGLKGASAEIALAVLAYNFGRALNLLDPVRMGRRWLVQPA